MKRHHLSLGKFKLKVTLSYIHTLARMAIVSKNSMQLELSCIAGGNVKWDSHLENSLSFYYKVEHAPAM